MSGDSNKLTYMMQEKEVVMTSMQSIASISEQSAASAEEQYNEMEKIVSMMNNLHGIGLELKQKTGFFTLS